MICELIVHHLVHVGIILEDDYDIYLFGMKQIVSTLFNIIVACVIGAMFGSLCQTAVFLICFMILRMNAGGYHAPTQGKCFILTMLTVLISLSAMHYINNYKFYGIAMLLSSVIIWFFAPIGTENKPLDAEEYAYYRQKIRIVWCVMTGMVFLGVALQWHKIAIAIVMSYIVLATSLLAGVRFLEIGTRHEGEERGKFCQMFFWRLWLRRQ